MCVCEYVRVRACMYVCTCVHDVRACMCMRMNIYVICVYVYYYIIIIITCVCVCVCVHAWSLDCIYDCVSACVGVLLDMDVYG